MRRYLIVASLLTLVLFAATLAYTLVEPWRQASASERQLSEEINNGAKLFGMYCTPCHGPEGEGAVGPPLNRAEFREGTAEELSASADMLIETIRYGRQGTTIPSLIPDGQGRLISRTAMPAWIQQKGGTLTLQEIKDLVAFMQRGDWKEVRVFIPPPKLQGDPPPNSSLPQREQQAAVELMQGKGCLSCHMVGNVGGTVGPDLTYVGRRYDADYLSQWLNAPAAVDRSQYVWSTDQVIGMSRPTMPAIDMTQDQLEQLVKYLTSLQ